MDMRKIKKLIELIQETGVAEIEIREGDVSVRIARERAMASAPPPTSTSTFVLPATVENKSEATKAENVAAPAIAQDKHAIKSPMVGTVYLSASPGAKAFVEIGQSVKMGEVVCLIEAMKMFNQIESDKTGTITARLVDNGTPVEFNQPLFIVE